MEIVHYKIRIMYGDVIEQFVFDTLDNENADKRFDEAVKEINRIYKEKGRFGTYAEVKKHFQKYGFFPIKL